MLVYVTIQKGANLRFKNVCETGHNGNRFIVTNIRLVLFFIYRDYLGFFHSSGKVPILNDKLKRMVTGADSSLVQA